MKSNLQVSMARIYNDGFVTMDGTITHSFMGVQLAKQPAKIVFPKGASTMYLNGDPVDSKTFYYLFEIVAELINIQSLRLTLEGKVPALTSLYRGA